MNSILLVGIIFFVGFVLGQEFKRFGLPKIAGYLVAGLVLNPGVCRFVPDTIVDNSEILGTIAIAFITFSIGGSIVFRDVKKLGKSIISITILEAEMAFLAITGGMLLMFLYFIHKIPNAVWITTAVPAALLLGCIGCPTDPSVALAVSHQYKAKGDVTSTILNVAAFDDVLGIINYSVAIVLARVIAVHASFNMFDAFLVPLAIIAGSVLLGTIGGILFNIVTWRIREQSEGVLFVVVIAFLTLCW
ncbi:MAG: cation:proton antiporter, partial [Candidatus Omnitrophota bacterium]